MKAKYLFSIPLFFISSFAYSIWVKANIDPAMIAQLKQYYIARCESHLLPKQRQELKQFSDGDTTQPITSVLECSKLEVKVISTKGGIVFEPVIKMRVIDDPSSEIKERFVVVSRPPWFGQYFIDREGDWTDYYIAF